MKNQFGKPLGLRRDDAVVADSWLLGPDFCHPIKGMGREREEGRNEAVMSFRISNIRKLASYCGCGLGRAPTRRGRGRANPSLSS